MSCHLLMVPEHAVQDRLYKVCKAPSPLMFCHSWNGLRFTDLATRQMSFWVCCYCSKLYICTCASVHRPFPRMGTTKCRTACTFHMESEIPKSNVFCTELKNPRMLSKKQTRAHKQKTHRTHTKTGRVTLQLEGCAEQMGF